MMALRARNMWERKWTCPYLHLFVNFVRFGLHRYALYNTYRGMLCQSSRQSIIFVTKYACISFVLHILVYFINNHEERFSCKFENYFCFWMKWRNFSDYSWWIPHCIPRRCDERSWWLHVLVLFILSPSTHSVFAVCTVYIEVCLIVLKWKHLSGIHVTWERRNSLVFAF